jgi:hypothetical protein
LLTNLRVVREADRWHFQLDGAVQPYAATAKATALQEGVSTLTNRLVSGPFRVELGGAELTTTSGSESLAPVAAFVSKLQPGKAGVVTAGGTFRLEGVFR